MYWLWNNIILFVPVILAIREIQSTFSVKFLIQTRFILPVTAVGSSEFTVPETNPSEIRGISKSRGIHAWSQPHHILLEVRTILSLSVIHWTFGVHVYIRKKRLGSPRIR